MSRARVMKRPRIVSDGESVFRSKHFPTVLPLTERERTIMSILCRARKLEQMYYEGALSLWMRTKQHYVWNCINQQVCICKPECQLKHFLLTALHLSIKYCGPACVEHHATTVLQGSETWTGLTRVKLYEAEIQMCQSLEWVFF